MERTFKIGDRVNDFFLGKGVIDSEWRYGWFVRFDEGPPEEYNGGSNPCARFEVDLTAVTPGNCTHCQKSEWIGGSQCECKDGLDPMECGYWEDEPCE